MPSALRSLAILGLLAVSAIQTRAADDLAGRFAQPPAATQPRCYWYWMDGHISKAGITKDLEAMKRVGIGGAFIGIISGQSGISANPHPLALTPEWWEFIEHAIREASRIGVEIGLFNSPGWSQTGGPWVTPEQAMRYVVQTETPVTGPQAFSAALPAPQEGFQPLTIQAFPAPAGDAAVAVIQSRTANSIHFQMPENSSARSITVRPSTTVNAAAELQASADGTNFRTIRNFQISRYNMMLGVGPVQLAPVVITFPAVADRFFRLLCSSAHALGDVQLSAAARVESFAEKSLIKMYQEPLPPFDFYTWPAAAEPESPDFSIQPASIIDLTDNLQPDGTLQWQVPPGDWIILRSGLVPTGTRNSPAPAEATGFEVDKMNRAALEAHFDAYITPLLNRLSPAERVSWTHVIADSYEAGPQNWTDDFAADFQSRFGYDPLRFLPVMGGRIVGSADQSERFLWDLRRFVADRIATEYVGGLRDLCHQAGLKLWLENYGHWGFPAEFLQYGGQSDEIGGEFWVGSNLGTKELRAASSAAHTYGKPVVWAEAFTGGPSFANTPRDLKNLGDWSFSEGVNQFVFHVFIHQPWEDTKPGVNAWFGTEFNRHNTWFESSKPWIDYLRRCSVMLQTGKHVADVAYYIGEDAPKMTGTRNPELPAGYDYDYINSEVIENHLTVQNGRFVLPDGMSYRLLVLPESATMRPAVLQKIGQLVAAGGAVLGPAPTRSPSLENFPAADATVQTLAAGIWANNQVMTGVNLTQALAQLNATPDIVVPADLRWKHRSDGNTDIYFLSNARSSARTETISFRVHDRTPELWFPETGQIQAIADYQLVNGRLHVPVSFESQGSVFVVFRHPRTLDELDTQSEYANLRVPISPGITGPWNVTFPGHSLAFGNFISWPDHPDPAIKYFSGSATYSKTFQISNLTSQIHLDLGTVHAIAKVRVNGQEIATLWKEPYTTDITAALQLGSNTLEVEVTNTWHNRLVGDRQPGVTPSTFITTNPFKAQTPLQPSGLLGPVSLVTPINGVQGVVSLTDSGFENPATPNFQYYPTGSSWTFNDGSGVARNASAFTFANPPAPEGLQVAFVQGGDAVISTPLNGLTPGAEYLLVFSAAQRAGYGAPTWDARINGGVIASFAPPNTATNYQDYSATFTASSTSSLLAFAGTNLNGGDTTVFIDNVRVVQLAAADPFLTWSNDAWPTLPNKDPAGDPDQDGIANIVEYVLQGGDPSLSNTGILPTLAASGSDFVFTYYRRAAATGTTQVFEFSPTLAEDSWIPLAIPGGAGVVVTDQGDGIDRVVITVPKGSRATLFGRLRVVR